MRGDRYGADFPARRIHKVPSATLGGVSPAAITKTALTLSKGVWAAYRLLGEIGPAAIVGFGGYPTFPPLLAARMRRVPSALHEQNAVLGRANRMLARRVDAIATSFDATEHLTGDLAAKAHVTGNPVRAAVIQAAAIPYQPHFPGDPFSLLVFGGSQGARFFSDVFPAALSLLPVAVRKRVSVVQQAREEDVDRVRAAYGHSGVRATVAAFFPNLPILMAGAHLVVGRAGASSVAELSALGRPSILVPLPHALDNDQLRNAAELAKAGGAWCIEQKELDPHRLAGELERLMRAPQILAAAAKAAKARGRLDAVERLADLVEELARGRRLAPANAARRRAD
jgi:UDP-N-acetylglucosamine--N-acetylmuramyl-(pentapeptide) pyrophosphoryl-undecaprenol N-acetylglucosamine transferase